MADSEDRIIALIDMDCFFCQVELREQPELKGKPMVVEQFNLVLAVNYEARDLGVSRFVHAEEAKDKCPELNVISVPIVRGKGDVSKYRAAGQEVIEVLKQQCKIIERASVDEAYLDITDLVDSRMDKISCSTEKILSLLPNTFTVGYCDDNNNDEVKRQEGLERWISESFDNIHDCQSRRLAIAAVIVEEFRAEIYEKCEFRCSAGISYNKVLAKLACGLHKPNKQTILPASVVPMLFSSLPVSKIRNLGGKIGKSVKETLGCNVMADLLRYSLVDLKRHFDDRTAQWLFNIARGIDNEPVKSRLISKSIGSSKNFFGPQTITDLDTLQEWVNILSEDVCNRLQQDLEENNRKATSIIISHQFSQDKKTIAQSRTVPLTTYKAERIASLTLDIVTKSLDKGITGLSISTSKFVDIQKNSNFVNYFKASTCNSSERVINSKDRLNQVTCDNENNVESIEEISDTSFSKEKIDDTSVKVNETTTLTQLREIFPDLENIDVSVLELLPAELQKEANSYVKSKPTPKVSISGKGNVKSKKNTLHNFVVKNTIATSSSMIRCNECNQMIQQEKYLEHCDFHVAHNLQRDINQSLNKIDNSKRNREKGNTPSPTNNKKSRSIASYFSK